MSTEWFDADHGHRILFMQLVIASVVEAVIEAAMSNGPVDMIYDWCVCGGRADILVISVEYMIGVNITNKLCGRKSIFSAPKACCSFQ